MARTSHSLERYRNELVEIDSELVAQITQLLSGDESVRQEVEESLDALDEDEEVSEYENSDAYNTGFEAASQGEPQSANPYLKGSWDNAAWQAGWDAQ
jgi:DNA repair exonuclease SbcCD ATPase subunit